MKAIQILMFCIICIITLTVVTADSATTASFPTDSKATIYGACKDENSTFTGQSANITIYYPNTSEFVSNASMSKFATGRFNYTFTTPKKLGEYAFTVACPAGEAFGTFQIKDLEEEVGMGIAAIAIMLVGVGGFIAYLATKLVEAGSLRYYLGHAMYIAAMWFFLGVIYTISVLTDGMNFDGYMDMVFIVAFLLVTLWTLVFSFFSIMDTLLSMYGQTTVRDVFGKKPKTK